MQGSSTQVSFLAINRLQIKLRLPRTYNWNFTICLKLYVVENRATFSIFATLDVAAISIFLFSLLFSYVKVFCHIPHAFFASYVNFISYTFVSSFPVHLVLVYRLLTFGSLFSQHLVSRIVFRLFIFFLLVFCSVRLHILL